MRVIDDETLALGDCAALLRAVAAAVNDALPALVFCDWLEDRGHPAAVELRGAILATAEVVAAGPFKFPPAAVVALYTARRVDFDGYVLHRGPVIDGRADWFSLGPGNKITVFK